MNELLIPVNTDPNEGTVMIPNTDPVPPPEKKPEGKYPLKGMPFDREDLSKATKRAYRAAGRNIPWSEARKRGYATLIKLHFPRIA